MLCYSNLLLYCLLKKINYQMGWVNVRNLKQSKSKGTINDIIMKCNMSVELMQQGMMVKVMQWV